ncbi:MULTISPECIES: DUF4276 family protein [unclassified Luteococcus]|uniref:DUF4276 family protein n=1 Tax=unclassified Luteococcus TaxID=2639923 RepID=UPI00313A7899
MKQIALVVEGQTEELFVREVLAPQLAARGIFLTPFIPVTSQTAHGRHKGGARWSGYRKLANKLAHEGHWHRIGVLLDLYGCPSDAPGRQGAGSGREYHRELMDSLAQDLNAGGQRARILPHVFLHEFEALVLAALDAGSTVVPEKAARDLRKVLADFQGDPELVNGGESTSPSHRIMAAWDGYTKTVDGIRVIADVPFDAILERCPSFAGWLEDLLT